MIQLRLPQQKIPMIITDDPHDLLTTGSELLKPVSLICL